MKKNSIINHNSYEKLLKEFHPTKNGELKLSDFSYGSHKMVWWKCDLADDHEWESMIYNRTNGKGCPYCSGNKTTKSNCLSTTNPGLLKEWHPIKNRDLTPDDITFGSHKKVWWKCDVADDHEWKSEISNRVNNKGCPFCSGNKVTKSNCLSTTNPKLSEEWHSTKNENLTPYDVVSGSNKKVWWKCNTVDDHEWEAAINDRKKGNGCSCCSGKRVVLSNCLFTTHPQLSKEWHSTKNGNLTPFDVTFGSTKKVWWKCHISDEHEWKSNVNHRTSTNKTNCPHCFKSKGQLEVERALKEYNIIYETEKTFKGCRFKRLLKFDTYLPDYNILIEYDGIQHYQTIDNDFFGGEKELLNRQKRDKIKDEYAKNNNIHLLRIPYTEFDNIESIITNYINCLAYPLILQHSI